MELRVHVDEARTFLGALFRDQLPFATSLALNRTAKSVQDAIRSGMQDRFTIRKPWVTQGITIPRFSDKRDVPMAVSVTVDPARAFLGKFEAGAPKFGSAQQPVAIPSAALRPAFVDLVPLGLYPKNLRLQARRGVTGILAPKAHVTRHGVVQIQGKQRTFVLDATTMYGVRVSGVYQRTGPGRGDVRLLWTYKASIPIPARLRFVETAQRTVEAIWPSAFHAAWAQAVRTAR